MSSFSVLTHGARGSIPAPGSAFEDAGGNTSCVEFRTGAARLLLDAGSGMRNVVFDPAAGAADVDLLLTHFHWDHIIGLPWLAALHDAGATVRIHAPCPPGVRLQDVLGGRLAPVYFPLPIRAFAAAVSLHPVSEGTFEVAGCDVSAVRVAHPSRTFAYRVQCGARSAVYAPDSEPDIDSTTREQLVRLSADADLLIHDAMYTEAEYPRRHGWGHATPAQAARLASEAGVRRLLLFHHDPLRTDAALRRLLEEGRCAAAPGLDVQLAREGECMELEG